MGSGLTWLDQYSDRLGAFLHAHVVLAPLLLLFAEEAGVPILIPGDAIIAYVGYGLSKHPEAASLWQALLIALAAVLIGASILFYLSKRWGMLLIRKLGRYVFVREDHIVRAEKLFKRYGVWAIIFGRHIPGLRIPITIFAASSGVPYSTFIASTFVSTVLWILFYLNVGKTVGPGFQNLLRHDTILTLGVFVALVLIVIGLHVWRSRQHKPAR